MNRRNETTPLALESEWPGSGAGANTVLNSDSRWALLSTSLSALIVGSVAWLAVSTMPPVTSSTVENAGRGFLPYRLFQELTQTGSSALFANSSQNVAKPDNLDRAMAAERTTRPDVETHSVSLDSGDTLAGALEDAGISSDDANAAIVAMGKVYSARSLRAGQMFDITYKNMPEPAASGSAGPTGDASAADSTAQLLSIKFSPTVDHEITITRGADGVFQAADTVKQLVSHVHRAGATINGSLYLSAMRAGIPTDVVAEMIKMFSYKVDFQRDVKAGDSFEVYYDYYYTPEGLPARQGNISYAMMKLGNQVLTLYRYQPNPNDPPEYFDAHGESVKGMLMKTPVDGARITSGFGMRFHPVLGYTRMHKGIDFGVPVGTPVMAAGSGTIAFMGWSNGYGRFVRINHGNGYSTAYGHLSRFASGLHVGSHVRQAQIIAYSGNTGLTTGPHLHYEIAINGQQVNPLKVKMAQGRKLTGKELREFQIERLRIDDKLASTKLETKVADNTDALRTGSR